MKKKDIISIVILLIILIAIIVGVVWYCSSNSISNMETTSSNVEIEEEYIGGNKEI